MKITYVNTMRQLFDFKQSNTNCITCIPYTCSSITSVKIHNYTEYETMLEWITAEYNRYTDDESCEKVDIKTDFFVDKTRFDSADTYIVIMDAKSSNAIVTTQTDFMFRLSNFFSNILSAKTF